jgi:hypothetical protein
MRTLLLTLTIAPAVIACGDPSGAGGSAAGLFRLETVDGCSPGPHAAECTRFGISVTGGTMQLTGDGRVSRTLTYVASPGDPETTVVQTGTYSQIGDMVRFAFTASVEGEASTWRPFGELSDGALTLRYPHPADGVAEEVFRRTE